MAPSDKAGRVVFVGNIPYGGTEELIIEHLSRVGQVLNFRLVYDKDTGRPKGFGFAEYADADAASSAVRNLNDLEMMGRKLRVDWSNDNGAGDAAAAPEPSQPMNGQSDANVAQQAPVVLPPLPPGADLPPNLSCPDAISRTLSTLPAAQLLDILTQMKGLVMQEPAKATELLRQAPQLAYAIFQALLLMNLVDTSILTTIIDQTGTPAPAAAAAAPPPQPTPAQPVRPFAGYPQPVPTPPVPAHQYAPPAPPAPAPPPQTSMSPEELYRAVMAMPQHQIDALPPDQRMQIMAARQMLAQQQQQQQAR